MIAQITSEQLYTTFRIAFNNLSGTAFLRHGENGSYFVTAAHTLAGARIGDSVLFQKDSGWQSAPLTELIFDDEGYDVCVFSSSGFIVEKVAPNPRAIRALTLGEPLKFLGFPHGLTNDFTGNGFPPPLVRNAFFSGTAQIGGRSLLILDGFNNPGYSGGPVYEFDENGRGRLFGMISGYRPEQPSHGLIYRKVEDGSEEVIPDIYIKPNSGMILAISMFFINRIAGKISIYNPSS